MEAALTEALGVVLEVLHTAPRSRMTSAQIAILLEPAFRAYAMGEASRKRRDVSRAHKLRSRLVDDVRGDEIRAIGPTVLEETGVPHAEHFRIFFSLTTGGRDPRGSAADPPLPRLVGRLAQLRGPRNDFAHECVAPLRHPIVTGGGEEPEIHSAIGTLQLIIAELTTLLDVVELACAGVEGSFAAA